MKIIREMKSKNILDFHLLHFVHNVFLIKIHNVTCTAILFFLLASLSKVSIYSTEMEKV